MLDGGMISATIKPGAGAIAAAADSGVAATSLVSRPIHDEMSNRWR